MAHLPLRYRHWTYVWVPLSAAATWFSTLLAMLITWLALGHPQYPTQNGKIAYISDIGATNLKPLFIVGCAITGLGFFLTLVVERSLRHTGRLMPNITRGERIMTILAILGSFIGACGLLLLSIFDTKRFPNGHRLCLLIFIVGIGLSAIFCVLEYRLLSKHFRDDRQLKKAYLGKGVIAGVLILLAIAFAVTLFEAPDVGAILEWSIAFGFTIYLLSFYYDLHLSKNMEKGELRHFAHPNVMTEVDSQ